jgi:hypothetical protein
MLDPSEATDLECSNAVLSFLAVVLGSPAIPLLSGSLPTQAASTRHRLRPDFERACCTLASPYLHLCDVRELCGGGDAAV